MTNKDLIKQKISEALSASFVGLDEVAFYSFPANITEAWGETNNHELRYAGHTENIKRFVESEIKSALETIDWSFLDAGETTYGCKDNEPHQFRDGQAWQVRCGRCGETR